jgi:hypothetical protein
MKAHPWFPAQQYAAIIQASNAIFHFDSDSNSEPMSSEIDHDIIALITSYGLDCLGLSEAIKAGDENEMTVLYDIYMRQKQSEKMNCIFRMSNTNNIFPHEQKSLPFIQSQSRHPHFNIVEDRTPISLTTRSRFPSFDQNGQKDLIIGQQRLWRPEVIPIRRKQIPRIPIMPNRANESILKVVC